MLDFKQIDHTKPNLDSNLKAVILDKQSKDFGKKVDIIAIDSVKQNIRVEGGGYYEFEEVDFINERTNKNVTMKFIDTYSRDTEVWKIEVHSSVVSDGSNYQLSTHVTNRIAENLVPLSQLENMVPWMDEDTRLGYLRMDANKTLYVYGKKHFERCFIK